MWVNVKIWNPVIMSIKERFPMSKAEKSQKSAVFKSSPGNSISVNVDKEYFPELKPPR